MKMRDFWKVVDKVINESDIVLEIIDARMPDLTRNRRIENKVRGKRKYLIVVINKSDLITKEMKKDISKKLKSARSVFISCKLRKGISNLKKMINELAKKRRYWKRIRIGVIGYPNTGKSTVINILAGRKVAKTSPIAGMTRGVQWIRGEGDILFLDTPGVIPLDEKDEVEQALMSVIDPNKIKDPILAAVKIIELFLENNKKGLEKFYKVEIDEEDTLEILLKIGKSKNFLKKGGKIDESRTALTIIRDWQRGKLLLS
jgi:hypothetical protein